MAVQRPTFSESWYRVANLCPRLLSSVQTSRQHFRGRLWHVLQDPTNNQYFRLNEPAYHFIGLLDGRRTVAEAWKICTDQLGDDAPTQGEAIQLLGQLYTSNLLHTQLPPDAESLFNRFRKRRVREVQGFLMNMLFIRIPLLDPDRFLERWAGVFGRLFTWYGLVVWLGLLGWGFHALAGRFDELMDRSEGVLNPENLPWLYVSMVLIKVVHEFGHAFACKRFGLRDGSGGEVHVMGVMFLVFAPLPYMDASSAWAFRSKWRRIVVGAAGMIVELGFAAVAAVVWAYSAKGTTVSAICYNVMFIASVSTVLFNGNPLLRYDAYYMLSDLLEIPNLAQRSRTYIYYLVRKYVWGVRHVQDPSHSPGEKGWLTVYALSSLAYRVVICIGILVFVADKLFIVGAIMAVAAVVAWVCVPIVKFFHYLATSGELTRVRARAVATTGAVLAAVLVLVGGIPLPDHYRVEGIVEPVRMTVVYGGADGFVEDVLPSGEPALSDFAVQSVVAQGAIALSSASWASGGPTCPAGLLACVPYFQDPNSGEPALRGPLLVRAVNPELESKRDELAAELRRLTAERRLRQTRELAEAQILGEQIASMGKQIRRCDEELKALEVHSPLVGQWVCPDARRFQKAYLKRGEPIGIVASLNDLRVRATAGQQVAAILVEESQRGVEIRVKGRPDGQYAGLVQKIHPAGQERLPSAALGFAAGGSMQTEAEDRSGTKASERFFEIQVALDAAAAGHFMPGQRVVVRFQVQDKPLAQQAWRSILQFVQRRFHI